MSIGDHEGGPNMGVLWKLRCFEVWRSNMTETGWGGPCFWRPTNGGCNRPGEKRSKNCFEQYAEDGSIVVKSGNKDKNNLCQNTVYSEDRVQRYTDQREQNPNQNSGNELSFALNFEVNLMNDFELDEEFRPVGCGGDLQNMWWAWRSDRKAAGNLTTINCPPNMARYEDGEALSEITTAFATNHDVWNQEFLAGWEKFVENGYGEDELVTGPEYSWLGYSHFGGWTRGNIYLYRF